MKKKLIFGVAAATLLSASAILAGGPEIIPQPDYFSGFYVGGTVSIHNLVSQQSSSFSVGQDLTQTSTFVDAAVDPDLQETVSLIIPAEMSASNSTDAGTIDVYGGVQGGFGKVFAHQFYLGVVGFGEWGKQQGNAYNSTISPFEIYDTLEDTSTNPATVLLSNGSIGTADIMTATTTQVTNDYGVAAKLGYLFTPTTMLYGKIGAAWANIKVNSSVNADVFNGLTATVANGAAVESDTEALNEVVMSGSASSSSTKTALLLGIGLEQFVYSDIVSVSLEYDYANFGTVNTTGNVSATGAADGSRDSTDITPPQAPGAPGAVVQPTSSLVSTSLPNALTASGNAKISSFQAALNFYFGRDWI